SILLDVVGPVFLVALVGYLWARSGHPLDSGFVALIVNTIATPCLIIDTLTRSGLKPAALAEMAAASCVSMGLTLAAAYALLRACKLPIKTFLPALTWSNGGNIGLPMCLFAFGEKGLSLAIAYFTISSLSNYTVAQGIAAGGMRFSEIMRMPIVYAIALSLALVMTGTALPVFAGRAVQLVGGIAVPLMLLSLGYALASLTVASLKRSVLLSLARLLGGFAIGWLTAWMFGLTGIARGVLIVESAMPVAVLNYLFAARYGNQPQEVAGLVIISTLMALFFLPFFLASVM
ncbi:MAG: AEC family transporter, partial [Beijerinckiaceae bacterium]